MVGGVSGVALVGAVAALYHLGRRLFGKKAPPSTDLLEGKTLEDFTHPAATARNAARGAGFSETRAQWLQRHTNIRSFPAEILSEAQMHARTKAAVNQAVDTFYYIQANPLHARGAIAKLSENMAPSAEFQTNPSINARSAIILMGEPGDVNKLTTLDTLRVFFNETERLMGALNAYIEDGGALDPEAMADRRQKIAAAHTEALGRLAALEVAYPQGKWKKNLNLAVRGPLTSLANLQTMLANVLLQFSTLLQMLPNLTGNLLIAEGIRRDVTATDEDLREYTGDRQVPWRTPFLLFALFGIVPFWLKFLSDASWVNSYAEWGYKAQANVRDDGTEAPFWPPYPWFPVLMTLTGAVGGILYSFEYGMWDSLKRRNRLKEPGAVGRIANRQVTYFPPEQPTAAATSAGPATETPEDTETQLVNLRQLIRTFQEGSIAIAQLGAARDAGSHTNPRGTAQIGWLLQQQMKRVNLSFDTVADLFEECRMDILGNMPDAAKMANARMKEHRPLPGDPPPGYELNFDEAALNKALTIITALESFFQLVDSLATSPAAFADFITWYPIVFWKMLKAIGSGDNEEKMNAFANNFVLATEMILPDIASLTYYARKKYVEKSSNNDLFSILPNQPKATDESANATSTADRNDPYNRALADLTARTLEIGQKMDEEFREIDKKNGTAPDSNPIQPLLGYEPFRQPGAEIPKLQSFTFPFASTVLTLVTLCVGTKIGTYLLQGVATTFARGFKEAAPEQALSNEVNLAKFNKAVTAIVRESARQHRLLEAEPVPGDEDGIPMTQGNLGALQQQMDSAVETWETSELPRILAGLPSNPEMARAELRASLIRSFPVTLVESGDIIAPLRQRFDDHVARIIPAGGIQDGTIPLDNTEDREALATQARNYMTTKWPSDQGRLPPATSAEDGNKARADFIRRELISHIGANVPNLVPGGTIRRDLSGDVDYEVRQLLKSLAPKTDDGEGERGKADLTASRTQVEVEFNRFEQQVIDNHPDPAYPLPVDDAERATRLLADFRSFYLGGSVTIPPELQADVDARVSALANTTRPTGGANSP